MKRITESGKIIENFRLPSSLYSSFHDISPPTYVGNIVVVFGSISKGLVR